MRTLIALSGVLLLASGCATQSTRQNVDYCRLPHTNSVEEAFAQVTEKLNSSSCHYHFNSYVDELIRVAKGSPGRENQGYFADLIRASIDRGIISKRQGQEIFGQYFDTEFYSVKVMQRSNCASLQNKTAIYADMKRELALKKEGLLDIANDAKRFRQAQSHFNSMQQVFDAISVACGREV